MKKRIHINIFMAFLLVALIASSCVPARKYEDMAERREQAEQQNRHLKDENENLFTQNNELRNERDKLQQQVESIKNDTTRIGKAKRNIQADYDRLSKTYEVVLEQNEKLMEGKELETNRILQRLQETQEDLQEREDELRRATALMEEKEQNLNALNERLQQSAIELSQKAERVNELESILESQEEAVQQLRKSVSNALLGFEGDGLSVEIKNGKVYVSLEERLLFATGSTSVGSEGVSALKQLAEVLERNPDISVLIEGHTDDVPFRPGSQIKDNWELSVLRATAIVRILLEHSDIDPQRLTAAGRGEHLPLDPDQTPEARQKNRRTEIILTPKLDDLFQIIESS